MVLHGMKYTVVYSRKVRVKAYESMEIGLFQEFDERTDPESAFESVKTRVEAWIDRESDRILSEHGKMPEAP